MTESHTFRFSLAAGFLAEARQDIPLQRWRSAMDNAQLAVENAAKTALALIGPVGRTHQPGPLLREAVQQGLFAKAQHQEILRLAELAELLGPDLHIQTDYGDETNRLPLGSYLMRRMPARRLSWRRKRWHLHKPLSVTTRKKRPVCCGG